MTDSVNQPSLQRSQSAINQAISETPGVWLMLNLMTLSKQLPSEQIQC